MGELRKYPGVQPPVFDDAVHREVFAGPGALKLKRS